MTIQTTIAVLTNDISLTRALPVLVTLETVWPRAQHGAFARTKGNKIAHEVKGRLVENPFQNTIAKMANNIKTSGAGCIKGV
jgi:hypothetical protein